MAADRARFDQNNRASLIVVSNQDNLTPVELWADPNTHALVTSGSGGGGSGTQYAAGSAVVSGASGNVTVFDGGAGTYLQVSAINPLPVTGGGGTQYTELATTTSATGTLALGRYQTTLPTLTNGQMNEPMLDSASRLYVNAPTATGSAVPANAFYISGKNSAGNLTGLAVQTDGTLTPGRTATSTITSVAGAATSTQLLASNTSRTGAYFYNDSTAILYLAFATSASTTAYTVQMAAQTFYEMPTIPVYTGAIFGIWASAAGNCRITELA
jgi:hypothetical protein